MAAADRAAGGSDLAALIDGDKGAWDAFVRRYAALIMAAVRGVAQDGGEAEDLSQEVFIRLCKDDFRLLKTYDPARAGLTTWLTIVARSTARDALRRRRIQGVNIADVPEAAGAGQPYVVIPDAMILAEFAESRLTGPQVEAVEAYLASHPASAADVEAAARAVEVPFRVGDVALAATIARATALVPLDSGRPA